MQYLLFIKTNIVRLDKHITIDNARCQDYHC